jgi:hypothetical protein
MLLSGGSGTLGKKDFGWNTSVRFPYQEVLLVGDALPFVGDWVGWVCRMFDISARFN